MVYLISLTKVGRRCLAGTELLLATFKNFHATCTGANVSTAYWTVRGAASDVKTGPETLKLQRIATTQRQVV